MLKGNSLKENQLIKKYSPILESIDNALTSESKKAMDDYKKYTLSVLMENVQGLIENYAKNKALMEAGTFQVANVPAKFW